MGLALSAASIFVILISEVLYVIARYQVERPESRTYFALDLYQAQKASVNAVGVVLSVVSIVVSAVFEHFYTIPNIHLSVSIFAPSIAFAGILLDWLTVSHRSLFRLPHNRLLNTILDETEEDLDKISKRYGRYVESISTHIKSLDGINSRYKKLVTDIVSEMHLKNVTTETLDLRGKNASKEGNQRDISCIKVHANIDGYHRFLKLFCDIFSDNQGNNAANIGHTINGKKCSVRVLSAFQPYEWFHTPKDDGVVTHAEEMEKLMTTYKDTFNGYERFKRYIPSNTNLFIRQKNLKVIFDESPLQPVSKNDLHKIGEDNLYSSTFPFREESGIDEEPRCFYAVINEEDTHKECLNSIETKGYKASNLLDEFCFGETFILYNQNPLMEESEYLFERSKAIDNDFVAGWRPIYNGLRTYNIQDFDEIFWVGINSRYDIQSASSIVGLVVNVRNEAPNTISILVDQEELRQLKGLFYELDNRASSAPCFNAEEEIAENGISKIGGDCCS